MGKINIVQCPKCVRHVIAVEDVEVFQCPCGQYMTIQKGSKAIESNTQINQTVSRSTHSHHTRRIKERIEKWRKEGEKAAEKAEKKRANKLEKWRKAGEKAAEKKSSTTIWIKSGRTYHAYRKKAAELKAQYHRDKEASPKRPQSAYDLYFLSVRDQVAREYIARPEYKIGDITKRICAMWRQLDPIKREPFEKEAAKLKAQYHRTRKIKERIDREKELIKERIDREKELNEIWRKAGEKTAEKAAKKKRKKSNIVDFEFENPFRSLNLKKKEKARIEKMKLIKSAIKYFVNNQLQVGRMSNIDVYNAVIVIADDYTEEEIVNHIVQDREKRRKEKITSIEQYNLMEQNVFRVLNEKIGTLEEVIKFLEAKKKERLIEGEKIKNGGEKRLVSLKKIPFKHNLFLPGNKTVGKKSKSNKRRLNIVVNKRKKSKTVKKKKNSEQKENSERKEKENSKKNEKRSRKESPPKENRIDVEPNVPLNHNCVEFSFGMSSMQMGEFPNVFARIKKSNSAIKFLPPLCETYSKMNEKRKSVIFSNNDEGFLDNIVECELSFDKKFIIESSSLRLF